MKIAIALSGAHKQQKPNSIVEFHFAFNTFRVSSWFTFQTFNFQGFQKAFQNDSLGNYCTQIEIAFKLSPGAHIRRKSNFNT